MSKYTTSSTNFTDRDCLVAALQEAGYTAVQVHDKAKNLTGYRGDTRAEKAEIIIPRKTKGGMEAYSNDVGFAFNAVSGKWEAIISEYDSGIFTDRVMSKVKEGYTEGVTKKIMAKRGLRWVGTTIVNGNRNLEFAVI
jgi:hypothetical protein